MYNVNLDASKKIMIFIGGINAVDEFLKTVETFEGFDDIIILNDRFKKKIVNELNEHGDIFDITDLFDKMPSPMSINPIVFNLRIPYSLQEATYRTISEKGHSKVDNFVCIYDGYILMVAAICEYKTRPWGVYDARDKFKEKLKKVYEYKNISPCLTHESIVLSYDDLEEIEGYRDIYIKLNESSTILEILQKIYLGFYMELWTFYNACSLCNNIDKNILEIQTQEVQMLNFLKEFMSLKWNQIKKKRNLLRTIRLGSLDLLKKLSINSNIMSDLINKNNDIEEKAIHNKLFNNFVQKVQLDEYIKPMEIDTESIIRIIDYARQESEIYRVNFSTLISALIGAVIGTLLTILATRFISA